MDRRTEKLLHKLELYYSFDFASGCHKMVIVFVLDDQLLKYIAFLDCSNSTFFTLEIKISLICQISVEVVTARTGVPDANKQNHQSSQFFTHFTYFRLEGNSPLRIREDALRRGLKHQRLDALQSGLQ